jgi:hypothetical protein
LLGFFFLTWCFLIFYVFFLEFCFVICFQFAFYWIPGSWSRSLISKVNADYLLFLKINFSIPSFKLFSMLFFLWDYPNFMPMILEFSSSSDLGFFFSIVSHYNIRLFDNSDRLKFDFFYCFYCFLSMHLLLLYFFILFKLRIEPMPK